MAIQGIGNVNVAASFRQNNIQAERPSAPSRNREENSQISRQENENSINANQIQRNDDEDIEVSVDRISTTMERDDDTAQTSETRNENPYGASGLQDLNNTSADKQQQIAVAARAYSYFNE